MLRQFWKKYYRLAKWWKYQAYYRRLPTDSPLAASSVERTGSEDGTVRVRPGIISRPMPTPTDVCSAYARRISRTRAGDGRSPSLDEDLYIRVGA
jgi:hypothetical protein